MNPAVLLAMSLAAAAVAVGMPARRPPMRRLRSRSGLRPRRSPPASSMQQTRWLRALAVALCVAVLLGGSGGVLAGVGIVSLTFVRSRRRDRAAVAATQRRLVADLPLAADLLGACIAAGVGPEAAARAVEDAMDGEIGAELRRAAAALQLGGDPVLNWAALEANETLAPLGRAFARAVDTGAPLSDLLAQVAADARQRRHSAAIAAARRAGVLAAAPLGLCFLPAFILLTVVPVVAGLVRAMTLFE